MAPNQARAGTRNPPGLQHSGSRASAGRTLLRGGGRNSPTLRSVFLIIPDQPAWFEVFADTEALILLNNGLFPISRTQAHLSHLKQPFSTPKPRHSIICVREMRRNYFFLPNRGFCVHEHQS